MTPTGCCVAARDTPEDRLVADEGDAAVDVGLEAVGLREGLVLVDRQVEDQSPLQEVAEGEVEARRAGRKPGRDPGAELAQGRLHRVPLTEVERDVGGEAETVGAPLDRRPVVGDGVLVKHRAVSVREEELGRLQGEDRDRDLDRSGRWPGREVPLTAHSEEGLRVVVEVVEEALR
jgi:hypothetical protein